MTGTLVLLKLCGDAALLLWGLHMVRSGVERAYGVALRHRLGIALRHRGRAFLTGLGVTALLQSSTATGLMTAAFTAGGLVDLAPALAVMLGANVGTTLIVQVLSFNLAWVSPLFILAGVVAFKRGSRTRVRDLARVAIGIGLMLLSLELLVAAIAPAESAPVLKTVLGAIARDPFLCVLVAAALTWAAHSSVAIVLLIMSFAGAHLVAPAEALALVLGANLGSAINPLLEGATAANPASRRLPVGNLFNRVVGCVIALPLLRPIAEWLASVDPVPARIAADFHFLFNLTLALLFFPFLDRIAEALRRLLPDQVRAADPEVPVYLDSAALNLPLLALACAVREALRMVDTVETMLRGALAALDENDRKRAVEVVRMDRVLDRLNQAIKQFLTSISPDSLDPPDQARLSDILAFSTNLEQAGDIVARGLAEHATKKIKYQLSFSTEGMNEIRSMHARLVENVHLAAAVFLDADPRAARKLVAEKEAFRDLERVATENHFARLREGRTESMETSSLHMDVLRDLLRIHAHLVAAAYPVLERRGELRATRLISPES